MAKYRNRMLRRGTKRVAQNDKRTPMHRLLESAHKGMCCIDYDQQWRTLWKAQRLGFVDDNQYITSKGQEYLQNCQEKEKAV